MAYMVHIIHLLVILVIVNAEDDQCDNNNATNCLCLNSDHYEYQCPPFSANILIHSDPNDYLNIDCYNTESLVIDDLPNYKCENVTLFQLRFCPLPTDNFVSVLDKFGIRSLQKFELDNVTVPSNSLTNTVSKNIFYGLSDVSKLNIISVAEKLDDDLLYYLINLTEFSLDNCEIKELNTFMFPPTLKVLHIIRNQLQEVPRGPFENLTQLTQLHLWKNNITKINKNDFKAFRSLKSLELSLNRIQEIEEDSFAELANLKTINLRANKLHTVHSTIFKYNTKLTSIRMEDNSELVLPDGIFANLPELITVNIKNSKIDVVPENVFRNSENLMNVNMQKNVIEELPENIFHKLSKINKLDLSFNRINSLGKSIFADLKNLETLNLDHNNLSYINSQLFRNTLNLISLNLQNNRLSDIDSDAFINLKSLKSIDLSNNLYTFEYNNEYVSPLSRCEALAEINLKNNRITKLPLFESLVHVDMIDLSYNRLETIHIIDLLNIPSVDLKTVLLGNNKIERVDFESVELMMNLTELDSYHHPPSPLVIDLKQNPLSCGCDNYDLIRYYHDDMLPGVKTKVNLDIKGVYCSEPNSYRHLKVTDLKPENIHCRHLEQCPKECECFWRPYTNFVEIDCSYRNLTYFPTLTLPNKNIELNLVGNYIRGGLNSHLGYENVKRLLLSGNKLQELKWLPLGIQILKLDGNELTHLDPELLAFMNKTVNLTMIKLSNNPWTCDCASLDLQSFIKIHYTKVNAQDVVCKEDEKLLIDKRELCKSYATIIMVIVLPILGVLIVLALSLILYIYFKEEVVLLIRILGIKFGFTSEDHEEKTFDIFVSYSSEDEDFVTQNILPVLEAGPKPFRTCIHIRDWEPGEMIITHVTNSILNSKRTLVVLSNNFLESSWGLHEFKTAHTQAIKEGVPRVIVVKYGELNEEKLDEDIKTYLTTNTYVEWGKPWFWYKLLAALPHSRNKNFYRSNQKHANVMLKIDDKFKLTTTLNNPLSTPPVTTFEPTVLNLHPLDR